MAPLEPWEKVLVNNEKFPQSAHGKKACIDCHGGVQSSNKETAHQGLIISPSAQPQKFCADCHANQVNAYLFSLHATQQGYWTAIDMRSMPENHAALEKMFGNHCATCHTTCGECHVSQPSNVGGGLFNGHLFEKTPPMTRSCTACHGSRVGNEFLGKNEGIPGDVHFREARMNCVKCHTETNLHGDQGTTTTPANRYANAETPKCVDCHPNVAPGGDENPMHQSHGNILSCEVCHSVTYTSCDGCHVAISDKSKKPFYETQDTYSTFLIGRNPIRSADRPYQYVTVRHIPIDADSYSYYGKNLLPNFNTLPTWAYATPHNIQLNTPQNASCDKCHGGDSSLFLTADKVKPEELEANASVIVETLPPPIEKILKASSIPADHVEHVSNSCTACHTPGIRNAPVSPPDHANYTDTNCESCHKLLK